MTSSDDIRITLSIPRSEKHPGLGSELQPVPSRTSISTRSNVSTVVKAPPSLANYSHSFWAPELAPLRRIYIKVMTVTLILTLIVMWICIPTFYGSLAHQRSYSDKLRIWFIDMDGSDIGNAMRTAVQANIDTKTKAKLGWAIMDASKFTSVADIASQVVDERAWGALVVPRNATSKLISARENGDTSYAPSTAMTFLYNQARNEVASSSFIVPFSQALISAATANFASSYAAQYLAAQSRNVTAMTALIAAPQTLTMPAPYTMNNLRPYTAPVASALTLVGSIYVIIFSFVITMAGYAVRGPIEPYLKTKDLLLFRVLSPFIFYAPLSFGYSMISLCFKVPFNAKYGYAGGFFIFWFYDFMTMSALGLSTEAMITLLTPNFMTYFLVPLIISNVAVASLPISLEPWFYKYGFGFPVYNMGQATRTIIFNTKSHLGLNGGVLISWIALSCCTVPLFSFIRRRRDMAAAARGANARGPEAPGHDYKAVDGATARRKSARLKEMDDVEAGPLGMARADHSQEPSVLEIRRCSTLDVEQQ